MRQTLRYFFALSVSITLICGIILGTAQQLIHLYAFDPQLQISSDIAYALSEGNDISSILPTRTINISNSLDTFVILYNENKQPISSTGLLNGKTPSLPLGVLNHTQKYRQHKVTWQPTNGLRYGTVITYYTGKTSGYILAARSLTEVEKRFHLIFRNIAIGWGITLVITFITTLLFLSSKRKKHI